METSGAPYLSQKSDLHIYMSYISFLMNKTVSKDRNQNSTSNHSKLYSICLLCYRSLPHLWFNLGDNVNEIERCGWIIDRCWKQNAKEKRDIFRERNYFFLMIKVWFYYWYYYCMNWYAIICAREYVSSFHDKLKGKNLHSYVIVFNWKSSFFLAKR